MTSPILVTGTSGMLGSVVIARLAREREPAILHAPRREELDLLDENAVHRWFATHRPKAVVHLAGRVRGLAANMNHQWRALEANARMALNLLGACAETPPERLVVAGSTAAYGFPYRSLPLREEFLMAGEPHPGEQGYAWAHRMLIAGATILRSDHGVRASVALLTNMFGPGDRFDESAHAIPALIARCVAATGAGAPDVVVWGRPDTTRDFIFSEDAAEDIVTILRTDDPPLLVNVASGHERTMGDVAAIIATECGFTGAIRWDASQPVGIPRRSVDTSTLQALADRHPVGFDEGLRRTVAWYRGRV